MSESSAPYRATPEAPAFPPDISHAVGHRVRLAIGSSTTVTGYGDAVSHPKLLEEAMNGMTRCTCGYDGAYVMVTGVRWVLSADTTRIEAVEVDLHGVHGPPT